MCQARLAGAHWRWEVGDGLVKLLRDARAGMAG